MASLDDILTVQKNGVLGINNLSQVTLREQGIVTSLTVTAPTLVFQGKGRLVNFAVVVAGSAAGGVYNSTNLSPSAPQQMCAAPNTIGIYPAGQIFTSGLVVVPGTGQSVNVTYSPEA
jgi:hypothetical protein